MRQIHRSRHRHRVAYVRESITKEVLVSEEEFVTESFCDSEADVQPAPQPDEGMDRIRLAQPPNKPMLPRAGGVKNPDPSSDV